MARRAHWLLLACLVLPAAPARGEEPAPRVDRNGDPLPSGALARFGSVRLHHGRSIRASALSPDGKLLATASGRTVAVWDLATGKAVRRFWCDREGQFVTPGLTFSPDGRRLAYVRSRDLAWVWDVRTGREVRLFDGNLLRSRPFCRFTPDGKSLAVSDRARVSLFDLGSGKATHTVPAEQVSFLSPDLQTYVRVLEGKAVILGDARTGKETLRLEVAATADGIRTGVAFAA